MRQLFVANVPSSSWDMLPGVEPLSKAGVERSCLLHTTADGVCGVHVPWLGQVQLTWKGVT
jgi:hypothetical protein